MPARESSPERTRAPAARVAAALGLALVLVLAAVPRVLMVLRSSPYVLHADEPLTTRRAARVLETGDPNPRFFRYPSLPIYATSAVFAAAHLARGEAPATPVGSLSPFYERPEVALAARLLVVALSLGATACVGLAAARGLASPVHAVLVPLLTASSARFLQLSWSYVNVDMFGAFVCAAAVLQVVWARGRTSLVQRAVLPGLLTGLAVGCKYYLGLVGLPALLALLSDRRGLGRNLATIVACTIAGFLVSTPYSVLDASLFVDQVAFELDHYAEGHVGAEGEPGLPQLLFYLEAVRADFGWTASLVGLFGIGAALVRRRFDALLLLAFPLALLLFLSLLRVHFIRNVVALYAFFPIFVSYGATTLAGLGAARLPRAARAAGPLAVAALLLANAPWARIRHFYLQPRDSRHAAVEWIRANVPPERLVLLCDEVQIDPRELAGYRVVPGPVLHFLKTLTIAELAGVEPRPILVAPAVDRGSRLEQHFSKMIRRRLDDYACLWRGGEREVPVKIGVLVSMGDPAIEVLDYREAE